MVIMIVSILKASHVSWSATEIAHSRLRHDVVRKLMHENYGRCGDGRQGPQKQVAARQADWDLGHVPNDAVSGAHFFARSGMPTKSR